MKKVNLIRRGKHHCWKIVTKVAGRSSYKKRRCYRDHACDLQLRYHQPVDKIATYDLSRIFRLIYQFLLCYDFSATHNTCTHTQVAKVDGKESTRSEGFSNFITCEY